MSIKRDFEDCDDGEIPAPQPKRPKTNGSEKKGPKNSSQTNNSKTNNTKTRQHQNSNIDPTWGQKYVFSSLDNATTIPKGEESEFEDDSDAMAYLMSVRQQASSIPHLLVAPKVQIGPQLPAAFRREETDDKDEGEIDGGIDTASVTDPRGFYEDGAYVGIAESCLEKNGGESSTLDEENPEKAEKALHEAYFAAVMNQYIHMRTMLHAALPDDAASRLDKFQPTDAAPFSRYSNTTKIWSSAIRDHDPHPLQVSLLSKDSVIRVLRVILGGKFLRRGHPIPERTSQWLWALLARLPDKGELNHTEIGWVRDLGRRAVLLGRSLSEMAALRDQLSETGFGADDAIDESSGDDEVVTEVVYEGDEHVDAPDSSTAPETAIPPDESKDEEDAEEGEVNDTVIPSDENKEKTEEAEVKETAIRTDESKDEEKKVEAEVEDTASPDESKDEDDAEEGEVKEDDHGSDGGDVAMDLASDSASEDGEITEDTEATKLEEAKRSLLAQLAQVEDERREEEARDRARMNMRATINMILTIAGEFYGQRDLLEFRQPFVGM